MANMKLGLMVAVGTVVIVMVELLLFPIALTFMSNLNNSVWLSTDDRTILANTPKLMIVMVLFTVLGGMIGAIYIAIKG